MRNARTSRILGALLLAGAVACGGGGGDGVASLCPVPRSSTIGDAPSASIATQEELPPNRTYSGPEHGVEPRTPFSTTRTPPDMTAGYSASGDPDPGRLDGTRSCGLTSRQ